MDLKRVKECLRGTFDMEVSLRKQYVDEQKEWEKKEKVPLKRIVSYLRFSLTSSAEQWEQWTRREVVPCVRQWLAPAERKAECKSPVLFATTLLVRTWKDKLVRLDKKEEEQDRQNRLAQSIQHGVSWLRRMEKESGDIRLLTFLHIFFQQRFGGMYQIPSRSLRAFLHNAVIVIHHAPFPLAMRIRLTYWLYFRWLRIQGPTYRTKTVANKAAGVSSGRTNNSRICDLLPYLSECQDWQADGEWCLQAMVESFLIDDEKTGGGGGGVQDRLGKFLDKAKALLANDLLRTTTHLHLSLRAEEQAEEDVDEPEETKVPRRATSMLLSRQVWTPQIISLVQQQDQQMQHRPFDKITDILLCVVHHLWVLLLVSMQKDLSISIKEAVKTVDQFQQETLWKFLVEHLLPVFAAALGQSDSWYYLWVTVLGQTVASLPPVPTNLKAAATTTNLRRRILELADLTHLQSLTTFAQMRRSIHVFLHLLLHSS